MTPHLYRKYDENPPGGDFQKNWVGVCGTLSGTLTLFQTKIRDFPYIRPDQKLDTLPYFRPEAPQPGA